MDARRRAEQAARSSYGRLLALMVARSHDVAAAEDALGNAFLSALTNWPDRGIPTNPDAWLLTAARNSLIDHNRRAGRQVAAGPDLEQQLAELTAMPDMFPDDRLKLIFVCAHPAIEPSVRAPLILQTVLGLTADRIARSFLIAPATLGQRLVRAKTKIRDAGLRVAVPSSDDMTERLDDVLTAIYAAFGVAWDIVPGGSRAGDLADEAIFLGRLLTDLLPGEPEAYGLLALMLHCHARRAARRDAAGAFVALEHQDASRWDRKLIIEAEAALLQGASHAQLGRFQLEAAIQSVHNQRAATGATNYVGLLRLYQLLAEYYPSIGASIGHAAVLIQTGKPGTALGLLDALPRPRITAHQPFWVTRAHALRALSRPAEARAAIDIAIGLSEDIAVRQYLRERFAA